MSIKDLFQKIFRASNGSSGGKSRIKTITLEKTNANSNLSLVDSFFWVFMKCISDWWDEASDKTPIPGQQSFNGDMPIFEVGCYTFFRLDLWFFMNQVPAELRQAIMLHTCNSFIDLFEKETSISNVRAMFDNRQEFYSSRLKEGEELPVDSFLFDLEQLILKTKNNQMPELIKTEHLPVDLDFGNGMAVKINVRTYEQHMIPAICNSAEKTISIASKQRASK